MGLVLGPVYHWMYKKNQATEAIDFCLKCA